jgi:DNA-binding CsgD family transcriptional regulator
VSTTISDFRNAATTKNSQANKQERRMKANPQSNAMLLDIGEATGGYHNTSKFIYSSWRMPDYALEYIAERNVSLARADDHTAVELPLPAALTAATQTPSAPAIGIDRTLAAKKIDAVLTPRQRDVFDLIVQGLSNKEIARRLKLAEGTMKIHIKALFAKLGVRRRAAVAVAGTRLFASSER